MPINGWMDLIMDTRNHLFQKKQKIRNLMKIFVEITAANLVKKADEYGIKKKSP